MTKEEITRCTLEQLGRHLTEDAQRAKTVSDQKRLLLFQPKVPLAEIRGRRQSRSSAPAPLESRQQRRARERRERKVERRLAGAA